ncbi:hypothetical protein SESBI_10652 [Sesbania bispinosa]|nr:hypothetical protein SESBI_10652 [Sesbania bispinosa]
MQSFMQLGRITTRNRHRLAERSPLQFHAAAVGSPRIAHGFSRWQRLAEGIIVARKKKRRVTLKNEKTKESSVDEGDDGKKEIRRKCGVGGGKKT